MPKVYMNEAPVVQTVGADGIGVSPPVPVEKVEKISGNTRGMEEVVPPVNRIPNPIDVGDGAVIQEKNNAWQTGADLPDPTNATDGMVLAVEDGKYIIADSSVQTDVADLVADPYDPNSTYDVGDIVVYENKLYVCKTAIATAEAWTAAHWDEKNMAEALEDGLASQSEKIDENREDFDLLAYSNVNLFDKTTATTGKYLSDGVETTNANTFYSDYIPVENATYITQKSAYLGNSIGLAMYKSDKTYVGSRNPVVSGDYLTYTIGSAIVAYVRFSNDKRDLNKIMFCKGTSYPLLYVPYQSARLKSNIPLSETQKQYVDDTLANIADTLPNMFDKTTNGMVNGYFSSGSFQSNDNYRMTNPIPVVNGTSYKYPQSSALGGNYAVAKLNESMEFSGSYINGTASDGIVTFTADFDGYVRINIGQVKDVNRFFCIKSTDYNGKYQPYGFEIDSKVFPNNNFNTPNLYNKKVVFDGDSICYGVGDTTGGNGYASRIGNANEMIWANVGVSGGTIAVVSGQHNLCTYIDTIHTNYPELDYLIFEGGSNDADTLTMEGIGEITADNDFSGTYDTSEFYGAVETLFYKALSYYPTAKIGFIIPTKMAIWSNGAWVLPERRTNFFNAVIKCCEKWGVPYLDLWHEKEMNPCLEAYYDRTMTAAENLAAGKMYYDHQHPNANGYDYMYSTIANWMNTL